MNLSQLRARTRTPLTPEQIHQYAPSVFAEQPHANVSNRYAFVPTTAVVENLHKKGWYPVSALEQRTHSVERQGYQKHVVKFQTDAFPIVDGIRPEIVLTNSHDRTSTFQFSAGLYRLVCSNGLIAFDPMFGNMNIKHVGYKDEAVNAVITNITENIPKVLNKMNELKQVELQRQEQVFLAISAAMEKWKVDENHLPFDPEKLLTVRRDVDSPPTLWNTYNTLQENLSHGGIRYQGTNAQGDSTRKKSRAITSIKEDLRVNKALWVLTENMRKLKMKK